MMIHNLHQKKVLHYSPIYQVPGTKFLANFLYHLLHDMEADRLLYNTAMTPMKPYDSKAIT